METLSEFVGNAVEFFVGGILFTISVALLLTARTSIPQLSAYENNLVSTNSSLVSIVLVAVAYAMGVVGEGLARSTFEILLDRITVRDDAFLHLDGTPANGKLASSGARRVSPSRWHGWLRRIHEFLIGPKYTIDQLHLARDEREKQRTLVMTFHVYMHDEVQSQLKRLRLERIFSMSLAVTTLALAIRGNWLYAALGLVFTARTFWLVHTRLERYCAAISRGYKLVAEDKVTLIAEGMRTDVPNT